MSAIITSSSVGNYLSNNRGHLPGCHHPSRPLARNLYWGLEVYSNRYGRRSNRRFSLKIDGGGEPSSSNTMMDATSHGASVPPHGSSSKLKTWILGTILSVLLPFWKNKWTPFLAFLSKLKGEPILAKKVDMVVDTIDTVTETVEKVAEGVEKAADEIASKLPEGGKLREAACFVENVAKEVAKDAHLADEFIHKLEKVEDEVEKGVECLQETLSEATKMVQEDPAALQDVELVEEKTSTATTSQEAEESNH